MEKLKKLTDGEWKILKDIRTRAVEENPKAFGDSPVKIKSHADEYWVELLGRSDAFVIMDVHQAVAMVMFSQDDDGVWSMKWLWTDPEYRGRGYGHQLIQKVLNTARERKIGKIELGINIEMKNAIELYESFGFTTYKVLNDVTMGDASIGSLQIMELALD